VNTAWATIEWRGQPVRIEYQWIAPPLRSTSSGRSGAQGDRVGDAPLIVFLHEGLGSLSMWKDFPAALCAAIGARGLVYSRPGYGRSTPRAAEEFWGVDFMHRQAQEVLPALFEALDIDTAQSRPWLFGHSDGGSIALLHAAHFPQHVAGLIVLAPHIFVEAFGLASIEKAREAYLNTDPSTGLRTGLRTRLAKYHNDPDSAFWGWNRIWLDPAFKAWSIRAELAAIACPVLAVQGIDDEYGTLAQIHGIAKALPSSTFRELLELPACGHSPHRDQREALIAACRRFILAQTA
jgi:pimeloyl-ACP methyl ester carboxylesterase